MKTLKPQATDPRKETKPTTLSPRFEQALAYAAQIHAGQLRRGTKIPYLSHLLAVTGIALEHGATEDEAIAALLHDAVEDAGGEARLADLEVRFGHRVARIVAGCTDTDQTPKPPWAERKTAHLAHLRRAPLPVKLVSACDKLHNSRSILSDCRILGDALWGRFHGGKEGTLWYYRAVVSAFGGPRLRGLAQDLDATVTELERLANGGKPVLKLPLTTE
jgi:(p)ppGpp synthase/HD superfamily hydrolase